jgi:dCMP deaminase
MHWAEYFLSMCDTVALKSKDPSTKVGAVITVDNYVVMTGYNGFAPGALENDELWSRPTKYDHVIHAEANAIANAARRGNAIEGGTLYCNLLPCLACARLVAASGIERVVYDKTRQDAYDNGAEHQHDKVLDYFEGAKIEVFCHVRS